MSVVIHHPDLQSFIENPWTSDSIEELTHFLTDRGTFTFPRLETGLYPAAVADHYTGYDHVWVRDNIHLAHGFMAVGEMENAAATLRGLTDFFQTQKSKFHQIIAGEIDPSIPMNRPHIRFDGRHLVESEEKWAHAQNDALGYYFWLTCEMARQHQFELQPHDVELLLCFPQYFKVIRYWQDKDNGHWEEQKKVESSSVGTVVRSLQAWGDLLQSSQELSGLEYKQRQDLLVESDELISHGMQMLAKTLPWECRSEFEDERRQYDAALLFLIAPLGLVQATDRQAAKIVTGVVEQLAGEIGIRRYLGDSYWCADYKQMLDEETRTSDFSDDMSQRDALLQPGEEAQWCIFDPILSVIFGQRFLATGSQLDFDDQAHHLNRSVAQITGPGRDWPELRCPESYYLAKGEWIPNDVNPLLWTQVNLRWALQQMKTSLQQTTHIHS